MWRWMHRSDRCRGFGRGPGRWGKEWGAITSVPDKGCYQSLPRTCPLWLPASAIGCRLVTKSDSAAGWMTSSATCLFVIFAILPWLGLWRKDCRFPVYFHFHCSRGVSRLPHAFFSILHSILGAHYFLIILFLFVPRQLLVRHHI